MSRERKDARSDCSAGVLILAPCQRKEDTDMIYRILIVCILLLAQGNVYAHGDVHERIEKLTKKFADQPGDEVLIRRARLFLEQEHAEAAREDLLAALQVAPARYESYYYLGQAQLMLKAYPEALQAADRFVARADNDAARSRGHTLRGDILLAKGKPLEAADAHLKALAHTAAPDPEHYIKTADAFHAARSPRALDVLERGIARLGPLVTLHERAFTIEMETARYQDALRRVDRMLATQQTTPQLLYKKGVVLKALKRPEPAKLAFQAALAEIEALPPLRKETRAVQSLRETLYAELKL